MFSSKYKLKLIIINSNENLKLIDSNPQLNPVESFRTHCSSNSYVSCYLSLKIVP